MASVNEYKIQHAADSSVQLISRRDALLVAIGNLQIEVNDWYNKGLVLSKNPWSKQNDADAAYDSWMLNDVKKPALFELQNELAAVQALIPVAQSREKDTQTVVQQYIQTAISPAQSGQLQDIANSAVQTSNALSTASQSTAGSSPQGSLNSYLGNQQNTVTRDPAVASSFTKWYDFIYTVDSTGKKVVSIPIVGGILFIAGAIFYMLWPKRRRK